MKKNLRNRLIFLVTAILFLMFQNCSKANFIKNNEEINSSISSEVDETFYTTLKWEVYSGMSGPKTYYTADLQVDFASKTMTTTSGKGVLATILLPEEKTISLTDDQIVQINHLISLLQTQDCPNQNPYTPQDIGYNRLLVVPLGSTVQNEKFIFKNTSYCAYGTSQVVSGYDDLTNYLISL
jgi:hypothetical protein